MSDPALLEIVEVSKSFAPRRGLIRQGQSEAVPALDRVSLSIAKGETLALVGESGSGKSTLARIVARLVEPDAGQVLLGGQDILAMHRTQLAAARRKLQMVFQDPYSSLNPRRSVKFAIAEAAWVHGLVRRGEDEHFVQELLERVGLPASTAARYPRELSGGQRQRVAIARALAVQPEVLIADEAVSALDVSVQAQILNLLESLRAELVLTMLFISHQLQIVAHIADRVAVMYLGRIVEIGECQEIFNRPAHPYTAGLLEAQPSRKRRGREPVIQRRVEIPAPELFGHGCRYRDRCPLASPICHQADPPMIELGDGQQAACHHAGEISTSGLALNHASVPSSAMAPGLARAPVRLAPDPPPSAV